MGGGLADQIWVFWAFLRPFFGLFEDILERAKRTNLIPLSVKYDASKPAPLSQCRIISPIIWCGIVGGICVWCGGHFGCFFGLFLRGGFCSLKIPYSTRRGCLTIFFWTFAGAHKDLIDAPTPGPQIPILIRPMEATKQTAVHAWRPCGRIFFGK